jgi:hypothetical protein
MQGTSVAPQGPSAPCDSAGGDRSTSVASYPAVDASLGVAGPVSDTRLFRFLSGGARRIFRGRGRLRLPLRIIGITGARLWRFIGFVNPQTSGPDWIARVPPTLLGYLDRLRIGVPVGVQGASINRPDRVCANLPSNERKRQNYLANARAHRMCGNRGSDLSTHMRASHVDNP